MQILCTSGTEHISSFEQLIRANESTWKNEFALVIFGQNLKM